jgi:hypothetical protein
MLVCNTNEWNYFFYSQNPKRKLKKHSIMKYDIIEKILYHTPRPEIILMHPNDIYAFVAANSNANKIEVIDMKTLRLFVHSEKF